MKSSQNEKFQTSMPIIMEDKFQKYLQFGGMLILRQFGFNTARVNEVLEGIYSTVILRDVLWRNKAADQVLLHKLVLFLADNIGSVTSPNNIGKLLSDEGNINREKGKNSVAGKTVDKYIGMLTAATYWKMWSFSNCSAEITVCPLAR